MSVRHQMLARVNERTAFDHELAHSDLQPRPLSPCQHLILALTRSSATASRWRRTPTHRPCFAWHHHIRPCALLAGQRSVTLPPRDAAAVYDAADSVSRTPGEPFSLQFTPVRCTRGRALQFERVALSAGEILHLVHDGFFGLARCREAAIDAAQACGVLPVPALGLPPLPRHPTRATAESCVDTLIDREPELHLRQGADSAGSVA